MAAKVGWTRRAFAHLDEAAMYIGIHSPAAAERLVIEALDVAETLAQFPERGRVVTGGNDSNCRELFVSKYRLVVPNRG